MADVVFSGTITAPGNLNSYNYVYTPGNPFAFINTLTIDTFRVYNNVYAMLISREMSDFDFVFNNTEDEINANRAYGDKLHNIYNDFLEGKHIAYKGPKVALYLDNEAQLKQIVYRRSDGAIVEPTIEAAHETELLTIFLVPQSAPSGASVTLVKVSTIKESHITMDKASWDNLPLDGSFPYFEGEDKMDSFKKASSWLKSTNTSPKDYDESISGGSGAGVTGSEIKAQGEFTGFVTQGGMASMFLVDETNYKHLSTIVGAGWLSATLDKWAGGSGNIKDAIIDIKGLKTPGPLSTGATVTIASYNDTTCSGKRLLTQGQKFSFGSIKISENFGSFLDYAPYTTIKIYLPYSGMYSIDASVVMYSTIYLDAVIDILSGNVLYYLTVKNLHTGVTSKVLYSWTGNVSCEIPVTADDYGRKVASAIATAGTVGAALVAPTMPLTAAATASATAGALVNYTQQANQYITAGSLSSNNGFGGVQYPYIIISRPETAYPNNYNHTVGRPSQQTATLSSLRGFTKIANPHVDGITATEEELREIENILSKGFYL